MEVSTCNCLSFPLINFCKHVCAVQIHYRECCSQSTLTLSSLGSPTTHVAGPVHTASSTQPLPPDTVVLPDALPTLLCMSGNLQVLVACTQNCTAPSDLAEKLAALDSTLSQLVIHSTTTPTLPPVQPLPSRSSYSREFSNIMPVVKNKRKARQPFNERSGKLAKADARAASALS